MTKIKLPPYHKLESRFRVNLFQSVIGSRPVHLIGTRSSKGIANLAVFSSVMHLGSNPPYYGFISRPETVRRDTLSNIRQTGFFTINSIQASILEKSHQTSGKYPEDSNEFEMVGLTEIYPDEFLAPAVGESIVTIGLELHKIIPLEMNDTQMVIGSVMEVWVEDKFVDEEGFLQIDSNDPVLGVLGSDHYQQSRDFRRMPYIGKVTED
jgi:flavin reductase (DIM6/NTAB) family NADH-FMN oxidoreductase RutF